MPARLRFLSSAALIAGLALAASGCGGDGSTADTSAKATTVERPRSSAVLDIVDPVSGAALKGPTVRLRVALAGAKIVPYTSTRLKPDEGHLHVLLDGRLVSMTLGLEQDIPNVAPGSHVVRAEFVANDHAPFNPRVVREVTFEVT